MFQLIARNDDKSKTESQKPLHVNQQQQQVAQQQQAEQAQPQVSQSLQDSLQGHQHEQLVTSVPIQGVLDSPMLPVTTVLPVPLTPTTPVSSVTPAAPGTPGTPGTPGALTPTTPTTPTFSHGQVLTHPQTGLGISATVGNHPPSGKSVTSKGKKTKEEKEREKEIRKQRLRIQQEQERQWKILQQKRALEQQRQQQQQQQENVLLRQELKKQQQAKGTKGSEEQKKKRLPKGSRRSSLQVSKDQGHPVEQAVVSSPDFMRESSEESFHITETRVQQPVLPVGASFSAAPRANANVLASSNTQFQNESSLEFLAKHDEQRNESSEEKKSEPTMVDSNREIPNSKADEFHSVQAETNHQYQGPSAWQKQPMEENTPRTGGTLWKQTQGHSLMEHPKPLNGHTPPRHEGTRQSLWNSEDLQSEAIQDRLGTTSNIQGSTPLPEQQMRPTQEPLQGEQAAAGGLIAHDQVPFHGDRQQSWLPRSHPHPSGIPTTQSPIQGQQPGRESGQVVQQPSIPNSMQGVHFSVQEKVTLNSSENHQQQGVELQQPSQQFPVMHWQEELSQVRAQVAAAHDLQPSQSVPPPSAPHPPPPPPPPPPLPPSQQQQTGSLQTYDMSTGWPQQGQVPPLHVQSQPLVPFPQTVHKPGIPQMPFQPVQQPPNQVSNNEHPNLPLSSQSQESQIMQPQQQQDVAQRQQREQLIRAQQQQFFQMLQQQQLLQQQQQQQQQQHQQQNASIQPGFARARFNAVVNTKDLPEIDTEEEHQERLRFLYRQRQAQKQQQMHAQLMQQAWFQQQLAGGGQGVMPPGVLPLDSSNPQLMQHFAQQIRPQMPDLTQQQLFAEYQRRLQQHQDLGQQTVPYDKFLQEFQQQQGISGGGGTHAGGPFVEVSQQRFALRQPAPIVQPGLKPIMPHGLDGHFVGQQQQLINMQLQQQMMVQQQKNEPLQKNTPHGSLGTGKVDTLKGNGEVSTESESEMLNKSVTPPQTDAMHGMQGEPNTSVEELHKPCEESESQTVVQAKSNSMCEETTEKLGSISSEDEKFEKESNYKSDHLKGELDAAQEIEVARKKESTGVQDKESASFLDTTTCEEECSRRQDVAANADNKKGGDDPVKHVAQEGEENIVCKVDNEKTSEEVKVGENVWSRVSSDGDMHPSNTSDVSRNAECKGEADVEGCYVGENTAAQPSKPDSEDNMKNKLDEKENKSEFDVQDAKLPPKPETNHDVNQVTAQPHHVPSQEPPGPPPPPPPQLQHFHRDVKPPSKAATFHEINQVPAQPHHVPSQGPPVPPPQPQHLLMQQQFMGLQQQFMQMEQQRQVLVQQYQQLQQQLHQAGGQDPVLTGQVMAVQSQGQVLQQQMVQVHKQLQLIQQQFAVQQQQSQLQQPQLGPQWPNQMGAQPGVFPVRLGVMGMQHPLQAGVQLADKVRSVS